MFVLDLLKYIFERYKLLPKQTGNCHLSHCLLIQQYPKLGDGGRGVAKFEHLNLVVKAGPSDYLRLKKRKHCARSSRLFRPTKSQYRSYSGGEMSVARIHLYESSPW